MVREYPTLQRKLNKITKQIINESKRRLVKWTGATWAVSGSNTYNTPTLGSELLTDGGFENWTTATNLTSWTEGVTGLSTINRESIIVNGGSFAARFDVNSTSYVYLEQNAGLSSLKFYQVAADLRNDASTRTIYTQLGTTQVVFPALTQSYNRYYVTARASGTTIYFFRLSTVTHSLYLDNLSCKELNLNSLFATITSSTSNLTATAKIVANPSGTQAGIVSLLDSTSSPANFLIAYHDGTNVKLEKCVAGTYTTLVTTAVTFVANATIEIRRPSGNTFQVWYNGVQRGTDQTVADAGIINNTLYGVFSTYSGNQLNSFTLGGTSYPFNF